jgi:glycosyltransferase involved in cell wall biosynthesis
MMSSANSITVINSTVYMAHTFKPKLGNSLGNYLAQIRDNTKGTADKLTAEDAGKLAGVAQSYISKLEDGNLDVTIKNKWQPHKQLALLRAYRLSNEEIMEVSRHFGLQVDLLIQPSHPPIPNPISKGDLVPIRNLGTIQAGLKGLSYASDSYDYVNVLKDDLNGYLPENCYRVTISGDSMVCSDVAQRIAPGTRAIFHSITPKMQPKDGDIVSVWLEHEDIGVIKVFNKNADYIILNSLNKSHRPIILDDHNQGTIQGVLISVTRMYR